MAKGSKRAYGTGSLFQRHRSWYGQWPVDGKLVKRKLGPVRSSERPEGLTRKQAEKRLRERMETVRPVTSGEAVTLKQAATRHIDRLEAMGRKPSTIEDYRSYLKIHLTPALGSRAMASITMQDIDLFQQRKLRDGYSAKSVRNWVGLMYGIFTFAQRQGWVDSNPVKLVDKPVVDEDDDIRFLNLAELDALLDAVPDDKLGRMEGVLYLTAAMTGFRQGEVLGLRWRDIDWNASRIRVRRNLVRGKYGTPKSRHASRSVPLSSRVRRELKRHRKRSRWTRDDDLVFCHPVTGNPYDRSKLLKRLRKAEKEAGVRQVTFHELRHTFGTTCAAAGIPLRTIMEWMGHRDIKTTMIYAHYVPGEHEAEWIRRAFSEGGHRTGIDLQTATPNSDQLEPVELGTKPP